MSPVVRKNEHVGESRGGRGGRGWNQLSEGCGGGGSGRSCTIHVRVISRVFPKWDRLLSIRLSAGLQLGDYRLTPRLTPVDGYTTPAECHSPRSRQVSTTHEVVATVAHGTSAPLSNSRPD